MRTLIACAALAAAAHAGAADHVVTQKAKAFSTAALAVKVGDRVHFRNEDTVAHNVFSLTEPMSFDLGTYGAGQSKDVVFGKEGKFEIECAIHPGMKMTVVVAK
jgi:plastocyanin